MSQVGDSDVARLGSGIPWAALDPASPYRWDWSTRQLHKVVDIAAYEGRCEAFHRFRSAFYAGCDTDPLAIDRDLFFLDYPELDLSITGLSSWFGNDCFCHVGAVDPELLAAAQAATAASSSGLHLAVWHHSIDGAPSSNDYLDRSVIHQLIDYGYRVGFHGHQHRGDGVSVELRLPTSERFAAVSAGSFAAWGRDLPNGVARQYNVVEIDSAKSTVLVRVRESIGPSVFAESTRADLGGSGSVSLEFTPRDGLRSPDVRDVVFLDDAATLFKEGQPRRALELLRKNDLGSGDGRPLMSEILLELDEFGELAVHLREPSTADELALLVRALCETREFDLARETVMSFDDDNPGLGGMTADLHAQIERRRAGL